MTLKYLKCTNLRVYSFRNFLNFAETDAREVLLCTETKKKYNKQYYKKAKKACYNDLKLSHVNDEKKFYKR